MRKSIIALSVSAFISLCFFTVIIYSFAAASDTMSYSSGPMLGTDPMPVTPTASPEPTAAPTPAPSREPQVSNAKLSITGDLMVHQWQLDDAHNKGANSYNFHYSFQNVTKYLSDADYTIGNFETVLGGEAIGYSDYPMFNSPDSFGEAVKDAGYDMVTTANNHCNDKKESGILRTIATLDTIGLEHIGTYTSAEERNNIFIKEINGIKFAFLSYTYGTNGMALTSGKPYLANIMSHELIASDIARAKLENPDFIVVLPHMGNEYETKPKQVFKDWINFMLESGADIVLASHPHVLQPAEFLTITDADGTQRECFVAYSLGNFVSSQRTIPRDSGVIMNLYFEKTEGQKAILKQASYIPTWVKFKDKNGNYDITVLSVFDTLNAYLTGENVDLRSTDIARLKAVHSEISKNFLGAALPLEELKNEYYLQKSE